ncbi:MAG: ANTAR domain-containing protein [Pseudomonadota bacterium]
MPSASPSTRVLLIADEASIVDTIQSELNTDYEFEALGTGKPTDDAPLPIQDHDIVVIYQTVLEQSDLAKIEQSIAITPIPVLVFVQSDPYRMARAAIRSGVTSFVVDGFDVGRISTLIDVTMERFKLSEGLRNELLKSQEELAARKTIERAKGLLMDKKQLNEQEAYRALRELAMRQSKPIKEVAETLLVYSDLLP